MSKDAPLFVDLKIFPERPAKMNTPFPERLSEEDVVLSLVVVVVPVEPELPDESSLPPQEIMADAKPAINKVSKNFFINFLNKYSKLKVKNKFYNRVTFSPPDNFFHSLFSSEC